ncbi:hypothetical protein CY34DRAFT_108331 [Suillus luteus UH-Slu-Lm8-n1]|uniref:Uncharacterized protein n=1 Tax=Suillus luteus UH-Slu-Lm8-n1 TaxID=930992 RepID=A0A0D0ABR8_9AGAM|nr:hypothetical protein CY34DRAFT_108331 [Suillus luteus UH-Slu-Lm8-n1]
MATKSDHDLIAGMLGNLVSANSPTITWQDGHVTVLPTVYNKSSENICQEVDIPTIQFMAKFPMSTSESQHVTHLPYNELRRDGVLDFVGYCLSINKPIVIRSDENHKYSNILTADLLDKYFAISKHQPVCIHDAMLHSFNYVNPKTTGTIESFFDAMTDPKKMQCILDLPLSQISLPEPLRLRMEVSVKFWVVFRPKKYLEDRIHLQEFVTRLVDLPSNKNGWRSTVMPTVLYKRPLLGLCIMVTKTAEYHTKGSSSRCLAPSEISMPSKDITDVVMLKYFELFKKRRTGAVMYTGSQIMPGELVDRDELEEVF